LAGARFVSAIESEDGEQLSETFVKQITGGEPVLARFLRQEFFEFIPEFKVFFTTNHKPVIKGVDEGIWRRIRLIPFNLQLPKEKRDKKLPEKLSLEMPGILNWAIEGCLKWQQSGLNDPAIVRKATGDYKEEMDILGPFMFECCFKRDDVQLEAKQLYETYANWCFRNGEHQLKNRAFYRILETQGFKRERGNRNKYYIKGVTLIDRNNTDKQSKLLENEENSENVTKSNTFKIS
ncbi:DNA primase family protein, partial [Bacillus thuringiensis]|uniref:DNA primase family protein n=1 Tax=Bacillus thuringiensis TaxID=1428 RepID=UPI001F55349E